MNENKQQSSTQAAHSTPSPASTTRRTRKRKLNPLQRPVTFRSFWRYEFLVLLVLAIAGSLIGYFWHQGYYYYSTDHAVVTGDVVNITPNRTGTITNIYYRVGDSVQAGQTIATLQTNTGGSYNATSPINGQIVSEGSIPTILVGIGQQLGVGQVI